MTFPFLTVVFVFRILYFTISLFYRNKQCISLPRGCHGHSFSVVVNIVLTSLIYKVHRKGKKNELIKEGTERVRVLIKVAFPSTSLYSK